MKHWKILIALAALIASVVWTTAATGSPFDEENGSALTVSPTSLSFSATLNGAVPPPQTLTVSSAYRTSFTASASVQSGGTRWLTISPSGYLTTNTSIKVSVNQSGLSTGTYYGTVSLAAGEENTRTVPVTLVVGGSTGGGTLTVNQSSLSFSAIAGGTAPATQLLTVSAPTATSFTASASVQSGGTAWLAISPSGSLTTNQTLTVSVDQSGLAAATYNGTISLVASGSTRSVSVTLAVSPSATPPPPPPPTATGYKLIGWNDLGMHCQDGKDYSIFGVLPPYNTIHVHLIDSSGKLVVSPNGLTVSYQAINDPLTNTLSSTSSSKTNFWQYASQLFGVALAPDMGLKGNAMPGAGNVAQPMGFNTTDNTWLAEGIPMMPYADAPTAPYPVNYFPMMRLVAKNSSGAVIATTDIVLPVSDEMTCSVCHSSTSGYAAAMPAAGWVNSSDLAKDVKLNILRKHDDQFKGSSLFQAAAAQFGYSISGLEATVGTKSILCGTCHKTNALGTTGVAGIPQLTTSMHSKHASAVDPATGQTLDSAAARDACYRCHPGPKTQCLRGVMGTLKTSTGSNAIECQSCHGSMSNVATSTRNGWLEEPNCQSCHSGTATNNSGQIAYTSVFTTGTTVRVAADQTFATNPNTPMANTSLYRFSKGHGGLQCEACHGSTHAEYTTPISNDNVQSTSLQGHTGMLAECTACHSSMPSTVTGGPHGLHPIGSSWVSTHPNVVNSSGSAQCQVCHGTDYRGTILSKTKAVRTLAGRTFAQGAVIGCYSCHNGPSGD